MDVDQAMIVAGIGCRRGTPANAIAAAIEAALAGAGAARSALAIVATSETKHDEPGIAAAAAALGVRLVLVPQDALAGASARTLTRSARVEALAGVPSLAEAAALAAAGPAARLVGPRLALGAATCALAITDGTP
jgi:cobalt-precorrin 5A hydrolase